MCRGMEFLGNSEYNFFRCKKFVSANRDIIANAGKAAAAIGGLVAVANQVAEVNKEFKRKETELTPLKK